MILNPETQAGLRGEVTQAIGGQEIGLILRVDSQIPKGEGKVGKDVVKFQSEDLDQEVEDLGRGTTTEAGDGKLKTFEEIEGCGNRIENWLQGEKVMD